MDSDAADVAPTDDAPPDGDPGDGDAAEGDPGDCDPTAGDPLDVEPAEDGPLDDAPTDREPADRVSARSGCGAPPVPSMTEVPDPEVPVGVVPAFACPPPAIGTGAVAPAGALPAAGPSPFFEGGSSDAISVLAAPVEADALVEPPLSGDRGADAETVAPAAGGTFGPLALPTGAGGCV